ncbi:MAG: hypothetical protein HYY37_00350 [Candidatus Aenigmarchaeota archaeon]|nr:hypothetical protein [Candidatus Aenigmarchaeota archaeon]
MNTITMSDYRSGLPQLPLWTSDGVQYDSVRYQKEAILGPHYNEIIAGGRIPPLWLAPHGWGSGGTEMDADAYMKHTVPLMREALAEVQGHAPPQREQLPAGPQIAWWDGYRQRFHHKRYREPSK